MRPLRLEENISLIRSSVIFLDVYLDLYLFPNRTNLSENNIEQIYLPNLAAEWRSEQPSLSMALILAPLLSNHLNVFRSPPKILCIFVSFYVLSVLNFQEKSPFSIDK